MLALACRTLEIIETALRRVQPRRQVGDEGGEYDWEPDPYAEEEHRKALHHRYVGSGVGIEYHDYSGRDRLVVYDLGFLRKCLGRKLWAFTRCFAGLDRLLVVARLTRLAGKQPGTGVHERWALLWMSCGTLREVVKAVDELEGMKVGEVLRGEDASAWREVLSVLGAWKQNRIYKKARDTIAFHLDERHELFDAGLRIVARERIPLHLSEGHGRKVESFPFAPLIMITGLFPGPSSVEEIERFQKGLRETQARLGKLLYRVFVAALRTMGPGLSPAMKQRTRLLAVLEARRSALFWAWAKEDAKATSAETPQRGS
jgi:hypothetical protein